MSIFYGQVEGQAQTLASRRGSYGSHIRSSVQSYDGSVITELFYPVDKDGHLGEGKHINELWLQVYYSEDSTFYGNTVFRGPASRFIDMCKREMEKRQ